MIPHKVLHIHLGSSKPSRSAMEVPFKSPRNTAFRPNCVHIPWKASGRKAVEVWD